MPIIFNGSKNKTEHQSEKQKKTKKSLIKHVDEYSEIMRKEQPSKNPLKAFAPKPLYLTFDSQLDEEHIILLLRRHPVTQVKKILILIFGFFFIFLLSSTPIIRFLPANYQLAVIIGWFLLLIGFALESFLVWFFRVYIITDERIIDVDFLTLVYKNISSAKIDNIEDITAQTSGVLASVIDYGTVFIQTAAEKTEFEFEDVPQPSKVVALLNELLLEEEREKIEGRVN